MRQNRSRGDGVLERPGAMSPARRTPLKTGAASADREAAGDPGRRAVSWAAGTTFCRSPGEDIVMRGPYLIGHADGSGELVFKNLADTPVHRLSRMHVPVPMSDCPEISVTLAPETFIQLRAGLFGTLPPWVD